jgi:replication factor C subunit 3/5
MFLIDKYKLTDLNDVVFHKDLYKQLLYLNEVTDIKEEVDVTNLLKDKLDLFNNMPHLYFYGPRGSGKRSIVNILLKKIYGEKVVKTNMINYSISGYGNTNVNVEIEQSPYHIVIKPTSGGFDKYLIQEIVKEYAKRKMFNNKQFFKAKRNFKIVFIDNVDKLSYYAQTSLRCTMEKYMGICKFILYGYEVSKVIEPLRSRCLCIRVPAPTKKEIFKTLLQISAKEETFLELKQYVEICEKSENNIKKAIWLLELSLNSIDLDLTWKEIVTEIVEIISLTKKRKLIESDIKRIRDKLYLIFITNLKGNDVLKELIKQLLENIKDIKYQSEIISIGSKFQYRLSKGKRSVIHLESFIYHVMYMLSSY